MVTWKPFLNAKITNGPITDPCGTMLVKSFPRRCFRIAYCCLCYLILIFWFTNYTHWFELNAISWKILLNGFTIIIRKTSFSVVLFSVATEVVRKHLVWIQNVLIHRSENLAGKSITQYSVIFKMRNHLFNCKDNVFVFEAMQAREIGM